MEEVDGSPHKYATRPTRRNFVTTRKQAKDDYWENHDFAGFPQSICKGLIVTGNQQDILLAGMLHPQCKAAMELKKAASARNKISKIGCRPWTTMSNAPDVGPCVLCAIWCC